MPRYLNLIGTYISTYIGTYNGINITMKFMVFFLGTSPVKERGNNYYESIIDNEYFSEISDGVSIIIPTYNRCLSHDDKRNPLIWCLSSVKQQNLEDLETIIVDDASTDLTYEKMNQVEDIDLKYIRNKERKGSSMSRNIGAREARNKSILFIDDDCIFPRKDAITTISYSFKELEKENNVGALHLPVYYRTNKPKGVLPVNEILGIDYEKGRIRCNVAAFPKERVKMNKNDYFDGTDILKPLEVNNLAGVFLCNKDDYLSVGGFPDFFPTPALGEEHELAQRFTRNGYSLFFTPEPKTALVHLKYGRHDKYSVEPFNHLFENSVELPISFEDMLKESRQLKNDTGNAVTAGQALYSFVYGRMLILNGNTSSKKKFLEHVKKDIVENNDYDYYKQRVNDRVLREMICLDAIKDAEIKHSQLNSNIIWEPMTVRL
jgi:glycosyltransferase involved in cell wall biosynthesis